MKNLFYTILLLLLALGATSCASPELKAAVAVKSAEVSDGALETVEWELCNAMPVGAIKRRFQSSTDRAAYNAICGDELP